jgi:hypothetical protein
MGTLWGLQRRSSAGLQAPVLTHLTWSALMLRYLPPLFRDVADQTSAVGPKALPPAARTALGRGRRRVVG